MAKDYAGDEVFDALLVLGWEVKVDDDGRITSPGNGNTINGKMKDNGDIEWTGGADSMQWIVNKARIKVLQARASEAAQSATIKSKKIVAI